MSESTLYSGLINPLPIGLIQNELKNLVLECKTPEKKIQIVHLHIYHLFFLQVETKYYWETRRVSNSMNWHCFLKHRSDGLHDYWINEK